MAGRERSKQMITTWQDAKTQHSLCILAMCGEIPVLKHFADIAEKNETQSPVILVDNKVPNLGTASKRQRLEGHLSLWSSVTLTSIFYFSTYRGKHLLSFSHMEFLT